MKYLFFFLYSLNSFAGGWVSSGGGELFRDARNPWFVKNTKEVSYCLKIDEDSISASEEKIRQAVTETISYWKEQLTPKHDQPQIGYFDLGTQVFKEVECDQNTDITLQFGYGTLSKEQIKFLIKPEKYIGITVRTDYDLKKLQAKGFVYIASDIGKFSYDNFKGRRVSEAWKYPQLLKYTLLHEFGHIFGIPHSGSGLMSEVFLDQMLDKKIYEIFTKLPVDPFVQIPRKVQMCDLWTGPKAMHFLGVPQGKNCLVLKQLPNASMELYAKTDKDSDNETLIGTFASFVPDLGSLRLKPMTLLQLPEEQTVFTGAQTAFRNFMYGPQLQSYGAQGVYIKQGQPRRYSVYLKMAPDHFSIVTNSRGKVIPILSYNSPLNILLNMSPIP